MDNLRKCKGKTHVYEGGKWHEEAFELGYFHGFGSNYEDFGDNGVGIIPSQSLSSLTGVL